MSSIYLKIIEINKHCNVMFKYTYHFNRGTIDITCGRKVFLSLNPISPCHVRIVFHISRLWLVSRIPMQPVTAIVFLHSSPAAWRS